MLARSFADRRSAEAYAPGHNECDDDRRRGLFSGRSFWINDWERLPVRVARNTERLLDILAEAEIEAIFFRPGLDCTPTSHLGETDRRSGARIGQATAPIT
jgi:hypothetical protein